MIIAAKSHFNGGEDLSVGRPIQTDEIDPASDGSFFINAHKIRLTEWRDKGQQQPLDIAGITANRASMTPAQDGEEQIGGAKSKADVSSRRVNP